MQNDITPKNLIGTNDIISKHLTKMYNRSIDSQKYPSSLKTADVTPIYKGKEKTSKENYRPVSILPIFFQVL